MSSFHLRFVGATELPKALSEFDVDQSFRLSTDEVDAIRRRFKTDGRLGASLQFVFIRVRATGRSLTKVAGIPRTLLRSLCAALSLSETSIASLKTIYQRRSTLFEHQKWAREASGLTEADASVMAQLDAALAQMASVAASVNDLVKEAEHWLFDRKRLLPGDRVLRDAASAAFASIETAALAIVRSQIPAPVLKQMLAAVYSKRVGRGGGTVLEWLKVPPGKHGPTGLNEATQKIAYLKTLGVDTWSLAGITNARLRAYSQAVVNRPPFDTKRLSEDTQVLELACFLRATLLELTDTALYMAGRRVCDLVRHATSRVQTKGA